MRGIKRVVAVFSTLVVVLVVLAFVLENQQGVSLSFLGLATGQAPVSMFVVVALIIGMLLGPLLGALVRIRRAKSAVVARG
ncbi:LapA family protein [Pseudomonas fluorescens]|uniref:LapA family protein n=1 Tax=Pseudomonas fluorescens TaxID=294 RepID=UPI00177D4A5D|nr:LapA family protein [Pseudomonas fluorescens]MBD8239846.1 LapA family protein [Pseudomonas fluorescens]MDY0897965.1 LapA family protein [Pseudomonas fluorescens]